MEQEKNHSQQKRCVCCGRFFRADKRVGDRQKCCARKECRQKQRKVQQAKWRRSNPGYFTGRSGYVKEWRKRNPDYQKRRRAKKHGEIQTEYTPLTSIKSIPLKIRTQVNVCEIQSLVLSVVYGGQALWVDGVRMLKNRDTIPDRAEPVDVR